MRTIEELEAGGCLGAHEFEADMTGPRYQAVRLLIRDSEEVYALVDTERSELLMLPSMEIEHGHLEFRHLAAAADAMNQRHDPASGTSTFRGDEASDRGGDGRFICELRETVDGPTALVTDTVCVPGFGYASWLLLRRLPDDEAGARVVIAAARRIAHGLNHTRYDYHHRLDPRSWTAEAQRELLASEFDWAGTPFAADWEALLAA